MTRREALVGLITAVAAYVAAPSISRLQHVPHRGCPLPPGRYYFKWITVEGNRMLVHEQPKMWVYLRPDAFGIEHQGELGMIVVIDAERRSLGTITAI